MNSRKPEFSAPVQGPKPPAERHASNARTPTFFSPRVTPAKTETGWSGAKWRSMMNAFLKSCTVTVALTFPVRRSPRSRAWRAKARSTSLPGPVTSNAAKTHKGYDCDSFFEKETGCKVNVKTANTSDDGLLMNEGGFDLVTASGDASLLWLPQARSRSPPVSSRAGRRSRTPQGCPVVHRWWRPLRRSTSGSERPDTTPGVCSVKSWNIVFEEMKLPDGKSNGPRPPRRRPIHVADAANYLMFHKRTRHQGSL